MKIITTSLVSDAQLMSECDQNTYLSLIACGIQDLRGTTHTFECIRPENYCKNYMLQIVLSGQGHHLLSGCSHTLSAGQCILYEPGQAHHITHYGTEEPVVLWLHFSGYHAPVLVEDLKLYGIHTLHNMSNYKDALLQMAREKRTRLPHAEYLCQSHLLQFLVNLSYSFRENYEQTTYYSKITPAINHMTNHYSSGELSNSDYAQMCFLSESRFSHIFREVTGTTPKRFLEEKRINVAKQLLSSSELKISEIARYVGYDDAYYFSRVFKKVVGVSPHTFLKQNRTFS